MCKRILKIMRTSRARSEDTQTVDLRQVSIDRRFGKVKVSKKTIKRAEQLVPIEPDLPSYVRKSMVYSVASLLEKTGVSPEPGKGEVIFDDGQVTITDRQIEFVKQLVEAGMYPQVAFRTIGITHRMYFAFRKTMVGIDNGVWTHIDRIMEQADANFEFNKLYDWQCTPSHPAQQADSAREILERTKIRYAKKVVNIDNITEAYTKVLEETLDPQTLAEVYSRFENILTDANGQEKKDNND